MSEREIKEMKNSSKEKYRVNRKDRVNRNIELNQESLIEVEKQQIMKEWDREVKRM